MYTLLHAHSNNIVILTRYFSIDIGDASEQTTIALMTAMVVTNTIFMF